MDAVNFLIKEHNKVRKTLDKISKGNFFSRLAGKTDYSDAARLRMFNALCKDLEVHEKMEETIWYPALKKEISVSAIVKTLVSEEKSAAKAIKSFKQIKSQEVWEEKFKKFKSAVLHHAKDEETRLFPVASSEVDEATLRALGTKMEAYKIKLTKTKVSKKAKKTKKKSAKRK
jgi:hemerythrin-like domain-containing protein